MKLRKVSNKVLFLLMLICPFYGLISQEPVDISVFAGPNITNVILRGNSLPSYVGIFTNPLPYNSVNYTVGVQLNKQLGGKLIGSITLHYEKIRSASNKFNDNYKPGIDANINYIGTATSIGIKPLKGSNVKLDIGGFFYYAMNKRFGEKALFISKRALWGPLTSIEFPVAKNLSFRTRFIFGLTNLRQSDFTPINPVIRTEKPYSLQLTFVYKIFERNNR